jgi:hypothetical protein
MASIISAGTTDSTSLNVSGDKTGILQLASNNAVTAVTIDASQNVGIGTSSPSQKLHVYGSGAIFGQIESSTATSMGLVLKNTARQYNMSVGSGGNWSIYDATASADRIVMDTSGNVGIGTNSPSYKLSVTATNTSGDTGAIQVTSPSTDGTQFRINNTGSGGHSYTFYSTGSSNGPGAGALGIYDQTAGAYRMVIDSSGNVGIGVTSPGNKLAVTTSAASYTTVITNSQASTPYGININYSGSAPANTDYGFLYCSDTSNQKLVIYSSGTVSNRTGTYNALSDIKIKQDISDATSQWSDIKAIKFRKYRLIDDVKANPNAPYFLGVVAQELEQTSPNLVDEAPDTVRNEDGTIEDLGTSTKQVKYSILYMKAVKALQEAMERIETLEAKADTQAETINALTARIVALEGQ